MKEVLLSRAINRRNPDDFLSTQKPEITDSRSYALILRTGVNRMTKIQSLTGCLDSEEQTNTYYSNTENMSIYYQELRDCLSFFQSQSRCIGHFFGDSSAYNMVEMRLCHRFLVLLSWMMRNSDGSLSNHHYSRNT